MHYTTTGLKFELVQLASHYKYVIIE